MSIFDWPITIIIIIKSKFEHSQKIYIVISSFGLLTHSTFNILKDSISSLQHFVNWKKKSCNYFRGDTLPHPHPPQKNSGKLEATQRASGLTNFLHRNPWCLTIWLAENTNRGTVGTPQDLKKFILSYLICTQICSSSQCDPQELNKGRRMQQAI